MKGLQEKNRTIATRLAFILIPISGLAMDIYVPSFPHMVRDLQATGGQIRLTLTIFLISYGLSQLFLGSIVDSFGRYRTGIISLAVFACSNFMIAASGSIHFILFIRAIQGIVISLIMVAKRSLFVDIYTGEKRKQYTSLLSIVWSSAPILAPFLGGWLQELAGWRANFYFLGAYSLMMLALELVYSGETLAHFTPWKLGTVLRNYKTFITRKDFALGVLVLGFSYSMSIVFGMSAPFIIEKTFGYTAITTGYCALASGVALLAGGILSRRMLHRGMLPKLWTATLLQLALAVLMYMSAAMYTSLLSLMFFVASLHFLMGFVYNIYFTYCLTRFPENAGAAGGFTSGGGYVITSFTSYLVAGAIHADGQRSLATGYLAIILLIIAALLAARRALSPSRAYGLNA